MSPVHILLQESLSDSVASHIVFASTEIGSMDVILGGSSVDSRAILPYGFRILPHGSSLFTQLRLQWHSLDCVVPGTDQGNSCGRRKL